MKHILPALLLAIAAGSAVAADHVLADGAVRFHAPDGWTAIMQKTDGDPQFLVFQVPNPQSSGTLARIGVSAHRVDDFDAHVHAEMTRLRAGSGFVESRAAASDPATLRFESSEEGPRQEQRTSFFRRGDLAVELSCARPVDAPASAAWRQAFDAACDDLAAQLAK